MTDSALFVLAGAAIVLAAIAAVVIGRLDLQTGRLTPTPGPTPDPAAPDLPAIEPPADLFPGAETVDRIGIVLVHGIGEQRRFEHLDSQLRSIICALNRIDEVEQMTVEIVGSGAAALHAEHDSWTSGPGASVNLMVRHRLAGAWREAHFHVHEVWWADVNERYSLAKQFRFLLWGLAAWAHPARLESKLPTASNVRPPAVPSHWLPWDHFRLWAVGAVYVLLALSIGLVSLIVTRVFNLQTPRLLQTIANYISAVKLYNQQRRYGPGLSWRREDFLDAVGDPPRVSVRRRVIRTIADVACARYHRWYVLAHSQGSVVAFNGLMETSYAWPGYLDEKRWNELVARRMAGPAGSDWQQPGGRTMPSRPSWAAPNDIAYRSRIFSRFCGFLSYGSPLEKFAGLWPALVPISKEPAFHSAASWINVFDKMDPVSGRLLAFQNSPPCCCPPAVDQGYAAFPLLLAAHTHYLTEQSTDDLAIKTSRWMLAGEPIPPAKSAGGPWYAAGSARSLRRFGAAIISWLIVAIVLAVLAGLIAPATANLLAQTADHVAQAIAATFRVKP